MIKLTVASIKVSILFLDSVLFPLLMIGRELFQELTLENITRSLYQDRIILLSQVRNSLRTAKGFIHFLFVPVLCSSVLLSLFTVFIDVFIFYFKILLWHTICFTYTCLIMIMELTYGS